MAIIGYGYLYIVHVTKYYFDNFGPSLLIYLDIELVSSISHNITKCGGYLLSLKKRINWERNVKNEEEEKQGR